jgi:hypothetical protein
VKAVTIAARIVLLVCSAPGGELQLSVTRENPEPDETAPATGELQSRRAADERTVELPDSTPEPGGPPVRVDPERVDAETAERMRPLHRDRE